ncbi:multicopper oxidase domain-containing protein [Erythrobacter vulgaris]|uniref:Multicopper oxidase domain-containing protein n=1 Tax=Qipengyuania vulgaris TaxID=291985 RepID=A0A844XW58_9SPHN|nr:multicopper oxidase domain-containing protein [Qipengyuania vulgaris]MXO49188.1 multicopper oxidase domain-containing protein [Qipengyuania vulgaris]
MKRRRFLQLSAVGGTIATIGLSPTPSRANSTTTETNFELTIAPANAEMIDGTMVYTLQYFHGFDNPSPEMRVREGKQITVTVTNNDSQPHGFIIRGVAGSYIHTMQPGQTGTTTFTAPNGGTYLYLDHYKGQLNRLMGLHGAFIVEPEGDGKTPAGSETPYSVADHNPQLQALFDAFGNHPRFPGDRWRAGDLRREKLWIFSQVDPTLNERVAAGELVDPASIPDNFLPRYFTINGLSGFDTANHHLEDGNAAHDGRAGRIMPSGKQGEPCLLRCINAGLATHACHIHGNHCFELARSDYKFRTEISSNIYEHDTWELLPLQRAELLLPFERPPDIPLDRWPPVEEPFPLRYVMHCHFELSQTAGGGNYPQGAVTHWQMTDPL